MTNTFANYKIDLDSIPTGFPSTSPTGYPTPITNTSSHSGDDDDINDSIIIGLAATAGIIIAVSVGYIIYTYNAKSGSSTNDNNLKIETSFSDISSGFHTPKQGPDLFGQSPNDDSDL